MLDANINVTSENATMNIFQYLLMIQNIKETLRMTRIIVISNVTVILIFILLSCGNNRNKNVVITFGKPIVGKEQPYPGNPDVVLKRIQAADSSWLIFEKGFKNSHVNLSLDNDSDTSFIINTNNFMSRSLYLKLARRKKFILLAIDNDKCYLQISRDYMFILVNYDSLTKNIFVDYTNEVPAYK